MPCFYPIDGFRAKSPGINGKRPVVFKRQDGFEDLPIKIPCGQCMGCRLRKSREWAIRMSHEAQMHKFNYFLTLTYSDEHLPSPPSLDLSHFQKFMKRLRKKYGKGVRFYHCGEYGEQTFRPHYHAILFGLDIPDLVHESTHRGNKYFSSESIESLWGMGHVTIGHFTFQTAAYTARYITKKITGKPAAEHYHRVDPLTGSSSNVVPEYATMSRMPGIGYTWYKKYKNDLIEGDFLIHDGRKLPIPSYYDKLREKDEAKLLKTQKAKRKRRAAKHADNNTKARLAVREKVMKRRTETLFRPLDKET